ncbi:MAG: PfkB family carbohydrate kinase [Nitrospira sp.]|nr:PfkB family carbohydrate kinase [Nitrospira sp.]MCP9441404.1 PfkB family carbohydrate kinase [Nitrospira sp.]
MGKLLVVGSVALDTVKTPFGERTEVLGGSATYFSTSASFFTSVALIAVVGEDFPPRHVAFLKSRGIDLTGLERRPGATFRWKGEYTHQLNEAHTLETHLNVFETFRPIIPDTHRSPEVLFLGNIDPELQLDVLQKVNRPSLVACDTMNFWITRKRAALWKVLEHVDVLIINDGEARALGEDSNLVKVAKLVLSRGPKYLIVKRGEYGVLMFNEKQVFGAPAFPLEDVRDPTGAGDTFAGGFLGYLAATGNRSEEAMKQAIIFGSVMASFTVESFSLDRLRILDYKEVQERFREFKRLTHFEDIP